MQTQPPVDLRSLRMEELEGFFENIGQARFRGRQVFRWLHARAAKGFAEMTDITKGLRQQLADSIPLQNIFVERELCAEDGTRKFLYRLVDGQAVEGVFMPEPGRRTLCISTQVGCGMGCRFCATGGMGLVRNLSAGEIVGQVEAAWRHLAPLGLCGPKEKLITNVVFMGMGEPLANLEAVIAAIDILLHEFGLRLSRRHITVSTVGLPDAMEELVRRVPIKLAVSLNASQDNQRAELMPVNQRFPLKTLLDVCRNLPIQHGYRITFEYVLFGGFNDAPEDARRLVRLLQGLRAKVNLIPYNPVAGQPWVRPQDQAVERFRGLVETAGLSALIRKSRGTDIQGACGQLAAPIEPVLPIGASN